MFKPATSPHLIFNFDPQEARPRLRDLPVGTIVQSPPGSRSLLLMISGGAVTICHRYGDTTGPITFEYCPFGNDTDTASWSSNRDFTILGTVGLHQ